MEAYPTRNGIAVPPSELELPESQLNLGDLGNFNTHHLEYTRRSFGRFALSQCLRDLERLQTSLPRDVHQALHDTYAPPEFPTEYQAASEIMEAYEEMENVRIYVIERKRYELYPIPHAIIQEIRSNWADYDKPKELIA